MTGGFLSVPIMRPNHRRTILQVSLWAALLLTLKADNEDSDCEVETKVPRDTYYEAFLGEDLRINCTVAFCDDSPPTVSWYKREENDVRVNVSSSSHITTEWKLFSRLEGGLFLIFQKILRNDSGVYTCRSGGSVSHNINVSVHGERERSTSVNETEESSLDSNPTVDVWLYMYSAAGILALVVMVIIISVVSMRGCEGKSKEETQTENQYTAFPMVEQPFPHARPQPSPRGSPSAPPSRRSFRTKTPPSQPNELPLPRDNEHVYGKVQENRERRGNTAEEETSSVVYAALNHQLPARAAAQPRRPKEEPSEYAAIRVKDSSPTRLNYFKADDFSH
ncbi:B- and T-lymphocyte attenuator [Cottoperca gobio]|uniref:B- and T-lymphocyte attenuator n=1 Tax=Cottoperca gobio TaxID=56716 RepID=A0A6J2QSC8_COTGO|nr:B- and T-lymphocyte attenuator [Cottoperca gobio]